MLGQQTVARTRTDIDLLSFNHETAMSGWLDKARIAEFLHESLKPWEDTLEDIGRGLDYALSRGPGQGGYVILGMLGQELVGAVVVLKTRMGGYVPGHLLLFIAVAPRHRGTGYGEKLLEYAVDRCSGDIALHVEYENPARRLYERVGFRSDYAEMRYRG